MCAYGVFDRTQNSETSPRVAGVFVLLQFGIQPECADGAMFPVKPFGKCKLRIGGWPGCCGYGLFGHRIRQMLDGLPGCWLRNQLSDRCFRFFPELGDTQPLQATVIFT